MRWRAFRTFEARQVPSHPLHSDRLRQYSFIREWMLQIAHALSFLHEARVAHRDGVLH